MSRENHPLGVLSRARFEAASFLLKHPFAYRTLCAVGVKRRDLTVRRDTDIVIEGYPRSGNSFSVYAFRQAQDRPVRIAHHHHAQAQIIQGTRWGIPVCVLIRRPEDAVRSLVVRSPHVDVAYALEKYIRFYRDVYPQRAGFVVGPFEEVTESFGDTIRRINRRFGTTFSLFEHTEEALSSVFAEIDRTNRLYNKGSQDVIARPTSAKDERKKQILLDPFGDLLDRARAVHSQFLDLVSDKLTSG